MMDGRRRAILALLAALVILAWSPRHSATDAPPGYLAWKQANWLAEITPLPAVEYGKSPYLTSAPIPTLQSYSAIAFESARDGNWEIYLAKGDGTSPQRLTDHPASDLYPSLNRGATSVVFASDRDGNLELYSVTSNGAGLQRLTFEPAADSWPAWSPDGKRIAFASRRDTDWDLYLMDADGGNVVRLTSSPDDDVQPCWSPDGETIAWVRRVNDKQAELHRIRVDGTSAEKLMHGRDYMQNPSWSTTGLISFDCDIDGDYFNEIVSLQLFPRVELVKLNLPGNWPEFQDAWMGSHAPTGEDMVVTIVYWVVQDQQLYLSHTLMKQLSGPWVSSSNLDMAPDWQTADITPPLVTLGPTQRFHKGNWITYNWAGSDRGPSGLRAFQVQVRDQANTQWRDWVWATLETTARFDGGFGYTYWVRLRAEDYAGNTSGWVEQEAEGTSVYKWAVLGHASDERGYPVSFAQAELTPKAVFDLAPNPEGQYALYTGEGGQQRLQVRHAGYADSVPQRFEWPDEDIALDVTLYHLDERLGNGGAEAGAIAPWTIPGPLTARVINESAEGSYGFQMGQIITSVLQSLPGSADTLWPTQILSDSVGTLHTLHNVDSGSTYTSYYLQRPRGGVWSQAEVLTDAGRWPKLTLDVSGTLHTVGLQYVHGDVDYAIVHKLRTPGGDWTAAERIPGALVPGSAIPVSMVDSAGRLHVLWDCYPCWAVGTTYHATRTADGHWTTGPGPAVSWTRLNDRYLRAAIGPGDVMHSVWYDGALSNGPQDSLKLMYSRKPPGALWSAPVQLAAAQGYEVLREAPLLLVGQRAEVYVLYLRRTFDNKEKALKQTAYLKRSDDGGLTWGEDRRIAEWDAYLAVEGRTPMVSLDEGGTLHAFWEPTTEQGPETVYSRSTDGGTTWSRPIPVGATLAAVSVVFEPGQGRALVGGRTAMADLYGLAEVEGSAVLEQRVDLSSGLHAPTLSFFYRLQQPEDCADRLKVHVDGRAVWEATGPQEPWSYVWLDLSGRVGTTATVSVELQSELDGGFSVAYVDGLALGSWLTPVIEEVTPSWTQPSQPLTITVSGANLLPGTVRLGSMVVTPTVSEGGTQISLVLPDGLPVGKYDLWVVNSGGQEAYTRSAVSSGWYGYLPLTESE